MYLHTDFLVRGAANDYTLDKRRLFQNETHFIYNPEKQKMNQLFDTREFLKLFEQKYKVDFALVKRQIEEIVRAVFAVAAVEAPGLHDEQVGWKVKLGEGSVWDRYHRGRGVPAEDYGGDLCSQPGEYRDHQPGFRE